MNDDIEIWKSIPEWPEYECSSIGNVRRVKEAFGAKIGENLKGTIATIGYRTFSLSRDSKVKIYYAHRLVAITFIGPIPKGMHVCHFDGDKLNNKVTNLRIDTQLANNRDNSRLGKTRRGSKNQFCQINPEIVKKIREFVASGKQQKEVAEIFGVHRMIVWNVINNRTWKWVE